MPDPNIMKPTESPLSIMPATSFSPPPAPAEEEVDESTLRSFTDIPATRTSIYDNVYNAVSSLAPVTNKTHTLRLTNVAWADPDNFSKKQRKQAQLGGRSLNRRLRGRWELLDNATGKVLDAQEKVIVRVPHLTDSGTLVHNGNEYAIKNQARLRAGIYSRQKDNGEIECFHWDTLVWTEHGEKTIGEIVDGELDIRVWSYDFHAEEFVLRRVTNWLRNRTKNGLGEVTVETSDLAPTSRDSNGDSSTWVTASHQFLVPGGAKKPVETLSEVLAVVDAPSDSQRQLVLGSLLAGGRIFPVGVFEGARRRVGSEYLQFKSDLLGDLHAWPDAANGFARLRTKRWAYLRKLRGTCYFAGVKIAAPEWLSGVSKLGLALWFCGGDNYTGKGVCLPVGDFDLGSVSAIVTWLRTHWDISATLPADRKSPSHYIQISGDEADKFLDLIAPYVPRCMHDKLRDSGSELAWEVRQKVAGSEVAEALRDNQSIKTLESIPLTFEQDKAKLGEKSGSKVAYDITVEGTHNYFANGILVGNSHAAITKGGPAHRYFLDKAKGIFYVKMGQSKMPLMPLLNSLGASDEEIKAAWGKELYASNFAKKHGGALQKLAKKLLRDKDIEEAGGDVSQAIRKRFEGMELDPYVAKHTLGQEYDHVNKDVVLAATKKLLGIARGEAETDDRDQLAYQSFHGIEDLIAERLTKDRAGVQRQLLFKATNKGNLKNIPSSALQQQLESVILESRLGQHLTEINPAEILDKHSQISRLGEGGIPCHSADTQVLTRAGWKYWPEVTPYDLFACLIDGEIIYCEADKLHVSDYDGYLFEVDSQRVCYSVTPDHRMWVRREVSETGEQSAVNVFDFYEARNVQGRAAVHLLGGPAWSGGRSPKLHTLSVVSREPGDETTPTATQVPFKSWIKFLGIYLARGYFSHNTRHDSYFTRISVCRDSDPVQAAYVVQVLKELGMDWTYEKKQGYTVDGIDLAREVRQLGHPICRCIPDYVLQASPLDRQLFLNVVLGFECSSEVSNCRSFFSESEELRDQLSVLAIQQGYSVVTGRTPTGAPYARHHVDVYRDGEGIVGKRQSESRYSERRYTGKVYCATVPGGLLLTKYKGRAIWSGNSADSVPEEARSVQPSQLGFMDLLRTPESFAAGVDVYISHASKKGPNNTLYSPFLDPRTGKKVWRTPQQLKTLSLAFPGALQSDDARVPAMQNGKMRYMRKEDIDLALPDMEQSFSPLGNLVPLKSQIKGQRVAMASRMSVAGESQVFIRREDGTTYHGSIEDYIWRQGDRSLSIDKQSKQIVWLPVLSKIEHKNSKRMARVELEDGRSVIATFDHSFVSLDYEGQLEKISPQYLSAGDMLPTAANCEITWKADDRHSFKLHPPQAEDCLPIWGELLSRLRKLTSPMDDVFEELHESGNCLSVSTLRSLFRADLSRITQGWGASSVVWGRVDAVMEVDASNYPQVYDLDMGGNVFMADGVFVHNTTQSLPLVNAEAPLVQSGVPGDNDESFEERYGEQMGAIRAKQGGRVMAIKDEHLMVQYDDGTRDKIELYQDHAFNSKTAVHQTPLLQAGESFKPGQTIVKSNFTDDTGATALGLNLRVGYMPWKGLNFEDALVISESASKRLTSEHMYKQEIEPGPKTEIGKNQFIKQFAAKYPKDVLKNFTDDGAIKAGTVVNFGDPVLLAVEQKSRTENKVIRRGQASYMDKSQTWEHHDPGVVTDVVAGKKGPVVMIKTQRQMQVADKLSGRQGDKGVVSAIIPDHLMPHDASGRPLEILANPLGVISRANPSQIPEAILGKIARKIGRPVKVKDFDEVADRTQWAIDLAEKHGISLSEALTDPETGRNIPDILTGERFFMKLYHMSEDKGSGRGGGSYTADGEPAKGAGGNSKRMGLLDVSALLSHGATDVIRDGKMVRGQQNEQYWLQFMQGHNPTAPKVPQVYNKFVAQLKGSGINVVRDGPRTNIMAMTNKDVEQLTGDRVIKNGDTVQFDKNLKPIAGGLFDPKITGGHNSSKWSRIELATPILNPVMEDPARRMLDLTKDKLRDVIGGKEALGTYGTGPQAVAKALDSVDIDREIASARAKIAGKNKGQRDTAIRKLGFLKSAKKMGLHPRDWVLNAVPVLPPAFRPISVIGEKSLPLVADANVLYKELVSANNNYGEMQKLVGENEVGAEALAVYDAFRAVTGLGDPVTEKSREKNIKGLLKNVLGTSPKLGVVQRKLLSTTTDNVGRAVIIPNPDLDMDSVGIPENKAYEVYSRHIIRKLRRKGMPMVQAMKEVKNKSKLAKAMLLEEMESRPVIANRAPVLHRFGIMAFKPKLVKGNAMQVSPLIVGGFGADFDGDDQISYVFLSIKSFELVQPMIDSGCLIPLSGEVMTARFREKTVFRKRNNVFLCHLSDFPHLANKRSTKGKNGKIDWHDVPEGVEVAAYNEKTATIDWKPVTGWSKHYDRRVQIVELASKRQIITDDDPRAVYGIAAGELTPRRFRPQEAVDAKVLVPRAARLAQSELAEGGSTTYVVGKVLDKVRETTNQNRRKIKSRIPLNRATGYVLGCAIGDGWVPQGSKKKRAHCRDLVVANVTEEIRSQLQEDVGEFFEYTVPVACEVESELSYGESRRMTWSSVELATLFARWIGHMSDYKQLPAFAFSGCLEFRQAVFAGLMDTDGSISVSNGKSKPQLMSNYSSNSIKLVQQIQLLASTLGIKGRITPSTTPAGKACWLISFSNLDIDSWGGKFMCHPEKLEKLRSVDVVETPASVRHDKIPLPRELGNAICKQYSSPRDSKLRTPGQASIYSALRAGIKCGSITRNSAKRLLDFVPEDKQAEITEREDYQQWKSILDHTDVTWDEVRSVTCSHIDETGYDLTVPGHETFMNVDGIILSNTMNYALPTTEAARKQALETMLPSRKLMSPADFKRPVHKPTQEYALGLFSASTARSNKPVKTFKTKAEAMAAYKAGKLDTADRVEILDE